MTFFILHLFPFSLSTLLSHLSHLPFIFVLFNISSLLFSFYFLLSFFYSGVIIGLERTFYTAGEGNGTVAVCAIIVSGQLARPATVELSTQDNTATGTY